MVDSITATRIDFAPGGSNASLAAQNHALRQENERLRAAALRWLSWYRHARSDAIRERSGNIPAELDYLDAVYERERRAIKESRA